MSQPLLLTIWPDFDHGSLDGPGPGPTCFLGDGEEVCEDDDELVNDGEWRGESQLELEDESHEDDDPTKPPPNCWRADVITSKK